METEIRELLRSKAGELDHPPVIPAETLGRAQRRRMATGAGLGLAAAVVAVAVIAGVGALRSERALPFVNEPLKPEARLSVTAGEAPGELESGFGSVWAVQEYGIARIDARSGKVVARIEPAGPTRSTEGGGTERDLYTVGFGLAAGENAVWVVARQNSMEFSMTASAIPQPQSAGEGETQSSATFSLQAQPYPTATPPDAVTATPAPSTTARLVPGPGQFRPTLVDEFSLLRIDPRNNSWRETAQFPSAGHFIDLAVGSGSVWVVTEEERLVSYLWRFSEATGKLQERIELAGAPVGVAAQGGSVWVAVNPAGVLRIDPRTNEIVGQIRIAGASFVRAMAAAEDDVWVSGSFSEGEAGPFFVARIDARSGRLLGSIEVPEKLAQLTAGAGLVWGIPEEDGRPVIRIVGNVFSGRLPVEHLPRGIALVGDRLWLSGVPAEGNITRYEF